MDSLATADTGAPPTAERQLRLAALDELFASSVHQAEFRGDAVRLQLTGEVGLVERVRDLADRESVSSSFFTFVVTGSDEHATLDISVPPEHRYLLDELALRAQRLSA